MEKGNEMNAETKILKADKLTYDVEADILYADGVEVGSAETMDRQLMLELADESWHGDDDEALFGALVERHE